MPSQDLQDEIRKSTQDMKGDLNLTGIMKETVQEIEQPFEEYANDLDESIKFDSTQNQRNNYFVQQQLEQKRLEDEKKGESSVPLDQQHLEE